MQAIWYVFQTSPTASIPVSQCWSVPHWGPPSSYPAMLPSSTELTGCCGSKTLEHLWLICHLKGRFDSWSRGKVGWKPSPSGSSERGWEMLSLFIHFYLIIKNNTLFFDNNYNCLFAQKLTDRQKDWHTKWLMHWLSVWDKAAISHTEVDLRLPLYISAGVTTFILFVCFCCYTYSRE